MSQITDIKALVQPTTFGSVGSQAQPPNNTAQATGGGGAAGNALPQRAQKAAKPAHATVDHAVLQVNNFLQSQNRTLEFSVDKSTGQTIVKVIDQANGKVVRQIPPEYVVKLAQTLLQDSRMSSTGIKIKT